MSIFLGAVTITKIKKTTSRDGTIYLGDIISKKGNRWKVYEKDVTRKKGDYYKFDWRIVREKDGLSLPTGNLPNVSLGDFLANKSDIKKIIDLKELNNS
jgi:hypothetical protein